MTWINLTSASTILGTDYRTLANQVRQASRTDQHGTITAQLDGVRFRKFGGRWKCNLGTWDTEQLTKEKEAL